MEVEECCRGGGVYVRELYGGVAAGAVLQANRIDRVRAPLQPVSVWYDYKSLVE